MKKSAKVTKISLNSRKKPADHAVSCLPFNQHLSQMQHAKILHMKPLSMQLKCNFHTTAVWNEWSDDYAHERDCTTRLAYHDKGIKILTVTYKIKYTFICKHQQCT